MRRRGTAVVEGASVLAAVLCVPLALLVALRAPVTAPLHAVVDGLVGVAVLTWSLVTIGLVRLVVHELRVGGVEAGPMGWAAVRVASLVLLVAPYLDSSGSHHVAAHRGTPAVTARAAAVAPGPTSSRGGDPASNDGATAHAVRGARAATHGARDARRCRQGPVVPLPLGSGALLVPLAADVRRRARLGRRVVVQGEEAVDLETALFGCGPPATPLLAGTVRALEADDRLHEVLHLVVADGESWLDDGTWRFDPAAPQRDARCLVVLLGEAGTRTHVLLVPRGATLGLAGPAAATLVEDALRVGPALGLGRPVRTTVDGLGRALALRADDELVVCVDAPTGAGRDDALAARAVTVALASGDAAAHVTDGEATLPDGRVLDRSALAPAVRALLDGLHDRPLPVTPTDEDTAGADDGVLDDRGVVVRLLSEVPRVDGLVSPLDSGRERRAVELLAYLALRAGTPVTGERLRVRVFGTASTDAAAKTLFNAASCLRRSLGDGPFGPRLPPAGRLARYAVAPDVLCDVAVLEARVARARRCEEPEEAMAWLRAALELVEGEPFATVLDGYDWFLAEGHLTRLQAVCEEAACELAGLALERGLLELASFALERAALVDPHTEALAAAAARVAAARQASLAAIVPAARRTVPSAPVVT